MEDLDPIEELHQVRRKILAEAGGTTAGLMRYLRSLEKKRTKHPVAADKAAQKGKKSPPKPATKAAVHKSDKRRRKVAVSQ